DQLGCMNTHLRFVQRESGRAHRTVVEPQVKREHRWRKTVANVRNVLRGVSSRQRNSVAHAVKSKQDRHHEQKQCCNTCTRLLTLGTNTCYTVVRSRHHRSTVSGKSNELLRLLSQEALCCVDNCVSLAVLELDQAAESGLGFAIDDSSDVDD